MIHTTIVPVPTPENTEIWPDGYDIQDGMAVQIGHRDDLSPLIAQTRPLTWRGDRLELCMLTWEQPDGEQPIVPVPVWGQAYKVPAIECVVKHAAGIDKWAEDHSIEELASAVIGPVYCYAEMRAAPWRYWVAVAGQMTYGSGASRNGHEIGGPGVHAGFPEMQRLHVLALDDLLLAPTPLTIGPLPLPAALTTEAAYPEWSANGSPYGAQGGGDGINPWGIYQDQRMPLEQSIEFLRRRGTGALYDNGGPIQSLPEGGKYHLDGPSDPGVCFGWDKAHDPLNWHGQDYSKTTHGVTDSQHLCRVLGALYPQAYRGAFWAINEIRCLAQTIVLCYPPCKRDRMGREDGWRMHAVAAAIHLTNPKDPMRDGWIKWANQMAERVGDLTYLPQPIDIQWDHGHLPGYGFEIGKGFGLSAPWESLILLSGVCALSSVGDSPSYFDTACIGLAPKFLDSGDPAKAGWSYKAVWSIGTESEPVKLVKWVADDQGYQSQDHYVGALALLFMPQITGLDFSGSAIAKGALAQVTAWAVKKGQTVAQAFDPYKTTDDWGWRFLGHMALTKAPLPGAFVEVKAQEIK